MIFYSSKTLHSMIQTNFLIEDVLYITQCKICKKPWS